MHVLGMMTRDLLELLWILLPLAAVVFIAWIVYSRRRALRVGHASHRDLDLVGFEELCSDSLEDAVGSKPTGIAMISPDVFELHLRDRGKLVIAHCVHRTHDKPIEHVFLENLDRAVSEKEADRGILVTNATFSEAVLRAKTLNDIRLMNGDLLKEHSHIPSEVAA